MRRLISARGRVTRSYLLGLRLAVRGSKPSGRSSTRCAAIAVNRLDLYGSHRAEAAGRMAVDVGQAELDRQVATQVVGTVCTERGKEPAELVVNRLRNATGPGQEVAVAAVDRHDRMG